MKKLINHCILLFFSLLLSGCLTSSTGVIPFGPDTYTVTAQSELGGITEAKKKAIAESNSHCQSIEKQMMPVSINSSTPLDVFGDPIPTYEITFRCLSEGDPDLHRPNMVKEADIVIENR
jgi:hypothetical protein